MEPVSMNDGLDGRETLAFGLAAGEAAVFVLALMGAYAALRSGLAGAIAWTLAAVLAGGGALLAWGRLAGRPLLEWAALLAGFMLRTRHARFARLRRRARGWRAASQAAAAAARARVQSGSATPQRSRETGAVVIPLALRRLERRAGGATEAATPPPSRGRVVGFFSLAGGTGRTTLAVEVATILAVRCRVAQATGAPGPRVALLDLARRNPTVGLRLGMLPPSTGNPTLFTHESGLLVGLAAASLPSDPVGSAPPATLLDTPECAATDLVIVDFDCDLDESCAGLLRRCDQLLVTLTPTAGGVVDAYRSTAVLRRMGLRDHLGHVVNRWRPDVDLGETMADLGGVIIAAIPDDPALVEAERRHRVVGLDGHGDAAAALHQLATYIEPGLGDARFAPDVPRWSSHAG